MANVDTSNKQEWYQKAEQWEKEFIERYGEKLSLIINPAKAIDKYAPDLYNLERSQAGDLKVQNIPFYTKAKQAGIPYECAWSFNNTDFIEYSWKYDSSFLIYIWIRYKSLEDYGGILVEDRDDVYCTTMYHLKRIVRGSFLHKYINRQNNHAQESYVVDLRSPGIAILSSIL